MKQTQRLGSERLSARTWLGDRRRVLVALGAMLILAALLRTHALDRKSLWDDEIFSLNALGIHSVAEAPPAWSSIPWNVIRYYRADNHPPFFFLLLGVWIKIFGSGTTAARMLPVVISLATLPVLYLLARRIFQDETTGLIAAALSASSAYLVFFSQEVRMYPLVMLLSCLSCLFFLDMLEKGTPAASAAFAAVSALGLYTHYYYVFLLLFQAAYWVFARGRRVAPFVRSLGWIFLAIVPWLPVLLYQVSYKNHSDLWIRNTGQYPAGLKSLALQWVGILFRFMAGENFIYPNTPRGLRSVCIVLAGAAILVLIARPGLWRRRYGWFLAGWLASPLLAGSLADTFFQTRTLEASKYFIASYPALILILSAAIRSFPLRESAPALLAAWLWLNGNGLAAYYRSPSPVEWRAIASHLSSTADDHDLLIAPEPRVYTCVSFYLRRPMAALQFPYGTPPEHVLSRIRTLESQPRRLWMVTAYEDEVPKVGALSRRVGYEFPALSEQDFPSHAVVRSYMGVPWVAGQTVSGQWRPPEPLDP
jgi:mannosyltransferase